MSSDLKRELITQSLPRTVPLLHELFTEYRKQLSYLLIVSRAYISHSYYYVYYLYTGSIYHIGDERKPIKDLGAAQTVKPLQAIG